MTDQDSTVVSADAAPTATARCVGCGQPRTLARGHVESIPVMAVYCGPCNLSTITDVLDEPQRTEARA